MSYYLDQGLGVFILAKLTLFLFPLFIIEWARRHRPQFARLASRACIGLYIFAYVTTVAQLNNAPGAGFTEFAMTKTFASTTDTPGK